MRKTTMTTRMKAGSFAAIRPYRTEDAAELVEVFRRSVIVIGALDYSSEQVQAWASRASGVEEMHRRYSDGRLALVAVDASDRPVAFGDLERDGHLDFLYAAPEVAGQGVASAIYARLKAHALASGLARLYTEASEAARRFFERKGFEVLARRELKIGETSIHNYAMETWL